MTHFSCSAGLSDIAIQYGTEKIDIASLVERKLLSKAQAIAIQANGSSSYYRSTNRSPEQLAIDAVSALLKSERIDPCDVNFLVFTSTIFESTALYPDLIANRIARKTGCKNAKAFALQHLYCVSPLAAMKLLKAYFEHRKAPSQAIVVCADAIGGVTENLRAINTLGLHSDGAAAISITNGQYKYELIDVSVFTDGSKHRGQNSDGTILGGNMYFAMAAKMIRNIITVNGITKTSAIELFPNNLDINAWRSIGRILRIPEERIHFDRQSGHVFGADPFINLKNADNDKAGYRILAATGIAGTFGAALLRVNNDG
jgi:3-oxoacyl-[acyl-carrier-protein] synthase III